MNKCGLIPDRAGYSVNQPAQVLQNQIDGGKSRSRVNFVGTYFNVNATWKVDAAGYNYLSQINRWSESNGCLPFLIDLVVESANLTEYQAAIVSGSFKLTAQEGMSYTVDAQLSVKPNNALSSEWPEGYETNKILQIRGNGAINSTAFPDSSIYNRSVAVFGNTKVQGSVLLFGDNCAVFDGAGDYLEIDFGTTEVNDFTFELMAYHNVAPSGNQAYLTIDALDYELYNRQGSGNKLTLYMGSNVIIGATTIPNNSWRDIAWVREGTQHRIYLHGVLQGTYTGPSGPMALGLVRLYSYGAGSEQFAGYGGQIQFTSGQALYSANYTPRSQGF